MADEVEENEESQENEKAKPKKKKLILIGIIGIVVLLLAGGGFVAYTKFFAPPKPAIDEAALKKAAEESIGEMFALEPFVVNLADPRGKRYLKVKITLELENTDAMTSAEKNIPKMRDMVIMMLTSLTFEEVMTPEGKIRVRDELFERFNLILRPNRIKNIFFTEFVVQ